MKLFFAMLFPLLLAHCSPAQIAPDPEPIQCTLDTLAMRYDTQDNLVYYLDSFHPNDDVFSIRFTPDQLHITSELIQMKHIIFEHPAEYNHSIDSQGNRFTITSDYILESLLNTDYIYFKILH